MVSRVGGLLPQGVQFFTPMEVATYLRLAPMTVYRMIERGELPAKRMGRQFRIPAEDFRAWEESTA